MRNFKLVDRGCEVIYEGIMTGYRLDREDIKLSPDEYIDVLDKVEYILIDGEVIYKFSCYLDETMTEEERNKKVKVVIYDKAEQQEKHISGGGGRYLAGQDFWDVVEYIREHSEE